MSSKIIYRVYQLFITIMVMWGAKAWFTWFLDYNSMVTLGTYVLFCMVAFLYCNVCKIRLRLRRNTIISFFILLLAFILMGNNIFGIVQNTLRFVPILLIIGDCQYKKLHLEFISKALALVIIIGLGFHFLRVLGLEVISPAHIIYGDGLTSDSYVFSNYYLYIVNTFHFVESVRFQSVFLEPGYLGTLVSFILFLNKYDFKKKYNIGLLMGLIFSLSLAAYIICAVGYICKLIEDKRSIFWVCICVCGAWLAFTIAPIINNGDNYFNTLIVERLQYDEDKGITGNNRFHGDTDLIYERVISSSDALFGVDKDIYETLDISGAGYKLFIIRNGVIPYMLLMLFYITLAYSASNKQHCIFACLLLFLISLQATTLEAYRWMIPFALAISNNKT